MNVGVQTPSDDQVLSLFKALRRSDNAAVELWCKQHLKDALEPLHVALVSVLERTNPKAALTALTQVKATQQPVFVEFLCLYLSGILLNRASRRTRAMASFLAAEKLAENQQKVIWRIEVLLERSTLFAWMGQTLAATDDLMLAIALLASIDYPEAQQASWSKLGHINWERNDYQKALAFFSLATEQGRTILDHDSLAKLGVEVAQCHCELNQYDQAVASLANIHTEQVSTYTQFLVLLLKLRLLDFHANSSSLSTIKAQIEQIMDGSEWQSAAYMAALGAYLVNHEPQQALDYLREAEVYFTKHALLPHLWRCRIQQVYAHHKLEQQTEAAQMLMNAKQVATETHNRRLLEVADQLAIQFDLPAGLEIKHSVAIADDYSRAENGFLVIDKLGKGGYGTVYRAYDMVKQCEIALKIFDFSDPSSTVMVGDLEQSLQAELQLISQLNHPRLIVPKSYGKVDQFRFYVTSRFVEGKNLRAQISQLNTERLLLVLSDVANGLVYAHQKGIIHRDIKPENILIDEDNRAYLIDFGNAMSVSSKLHKSDASGTLPYMSPEVLEGKRSSPAQDIFALSVVCCEALLGAHPFNDNVATSGIAYRFQLAKLKKVLAPTLNNSVILSLLIDALHPNAAKRPTAMDFVNALENK
ncbi:serine/threonine-protein kinase [Alteromonas sp. ASW11-36]|uniref:non-specific serine/threonine protein kinase n=1 Tax=Alteromonas arenosi TaxID=3055817 RepID=A0ABT7SY65_9ALTE|nr:serine/threonine-protein kinase [Alteromonas sp. ASW11-36]MDM7861125.1 serine/threonine-protein kinase [Alteromonas sp. ASW11-36]